MSGQTDMTIFETQLLLEVRGIHGFNPKLTKSAKWTKWVTNFGAGTCGYCSEQHGKIFDRYIPPPIVPPVHPRCGCHIDVMMAILAGTATIDGIRGADYYIKYLKSLPKNYVLKSYAKSMGWINYKGNLREVIQGATMGGDIYKNKKSKLPNAPGRIWYEADINYTGGHRNTHRLLYSNDGLIFVTFNHYLTFYEIN